MIHENECEYGILIKVANGCPMVDLSMIYKFFQTYSTFFAIGFVIVGMIIGVFGRPMWNSIVFLLFTMTVTGIFLVIFYEYVLPFSSPNWVLWLIFLISLTFGVFTAYMIARYQNAGFILLGVWFGASFTILFKNIIFRIVVAAFLIYKMWKKERVKSIILATGLLVIPSIYTIWANEITFWVCLVATSALGGISAYFLKDLLVTITTSFIGAYLTIRGISIPLGGFPSEYEIYKQIKSGNLEVILF